MRRGEKKKTSTGHCWVSSLPALVLIVQRCKTGLEILERKKKKKGKKTEKSLVSRLEREQRLVIQQTKTRGDAQSGSLHPSKGQLSVTGGLTVITLGAGCSGCSGRSGRSGGVQTRPPP